jgi:N-acetylglutamate synthase-like GNAT family acetyltransferase
MPLLSSYIRLAETADFEDAWELLREYFEAAQVVVRDSKESVLKQLRQECDNSGIWLAYTNGGAAGCIALRPLTTATAEVKRLYVRECSRGLGIASQLLAALETHAIAAGFRTLYLDTTDHMREAIAFYERSGYKRCERYNDNPQATIFFQKALEHPVQVRDFRSGDEEAFRSLNEAWISQLFALEAKDIQVLREPQRYILDLGGRIYVACRGGESVGCCALLKEEDGAYELGKMGVAERERGRGVGRKLLEYVIADARRLGIARLYLETNHKLENAIHLYESVGFRRLNPADVAPSPYARSDVYMEMILS